jgi:MYXO-CTERM domain-containing protein
MRAIITLVASLLLVSSAFANDTAMGGQGANLVPLQTSDVFMESEDITLTLSGAKGFLTAAESAAHVRGKWLVEARYVFVHPGAEPVTLQVGFPEYRCETTEPDAVEFCPPDKLFRFEEMETTVRGKRVPHRKGRVDTKHAWAPLLGGVWLFDLAFAPGERVEVVHRYRVPSSIDSQGGRGVTYVTRTGALWARPIGHARFTFRYPPRACFVHGPESVPLTSFRLSEESGELIGEATYELHDWKPIADLDFHVQPCLVARDFFEHEIDKPSVCSLRRAIASVVYGTGEHSEEEPPSERDDVLRRLSALEEDELRRCRNYPFAAHGRPFADTQLARAFYGSQALSSGLLTPFAPSAHYTDKLLTSADWRWIRFVDEAIARRPASPAPVAPGPAPAVSGREPAASSPPAPVPRSTSVSCTGCSVARPGAQARALLAGLLAALALTRLRRRHSSA